MLMSAIKPLRCKCYLPVIKSVFVSRPQQPRRPRSWLHLIAWSIRAALTQASHWLQNSILVSVHARVHVPKKENHTTSAPLLSALWREEPAVLLQTGRVGAKPASMWIRKDWSLQSKDCNRNFVVRRSNLCIHVYLYTIFKLQYMVLF